MDEGTAVIAARTRRAANERIRQTVDVVSDDAASHEWNFFCECGDPGCDMTVRLRVDAFDALARGSDRRIVAPAHTPLMRSA